MNDITWCVQEEEGVVHAAAVDAYHYRIVYRPETLIPDIDLRTSGQEG